MAKSNVRAGLWVLAGKIGGKLLPALVKGLKLLKVGKVGLAAASFAGYAVLFSWKFALLIMLALAWHESGHVWAMKRCGIKTKGFYFIPFVGGAAVASEPFKSYNQQVFIAIMGPIWGLLMAWASGVLYWYTHDPLWAAAAGWMATVNIFNLLPVNPLDGGQISKALAFSIHEKVGLVFLLLSCIACIILTWKLHIFLFAILLIVGALELLLQGWLKSKNNITADGKVVSYRFDGKWIDVPDRLTNWGFVGAITGYLTVTGLSIYLLLLMKHIPGADLAANFLE